VQTPARQREIAMPVTRLNILTAILTVWWCTVAPLSAALSAPREGTVLHPSRSAVVIGRAVRPSKTIVPASGRRDMWQVIDQVSTSELGGARNTTRSRTQSHAPCVKPCSAARIQRSKVLR